MRVRRPRARDSVTSGLWAGKEPSVYDHPKEPCVSRGNPSTGKLRVCMTTCTGRHLDHRALPPIGLPRWYPKIFPWNRRCGGMIAWMGGEPSPKLSRGKKKEYRNLEHGLSSENSVTVLAEREMGCSVREKRGAEWSEPGSICCRLRRRRGAAATLPPVCTGC